MRVAFFGYGKMGVKALNALQQDGKTIVAVYSHSLSSGDAYDESVEAWAQNAEVPLILVPSYRRYHDTSLLENQSLDLILSVFFRAPLGKDLLSIPRLGAYNLHPSLLPKYRGRSPVNWAILEGETQTGWSFHEMVETIDAGRIVLQEALSIDLQDHARDILDRLGHRLPDLLLEGLSRVTSSSEPNFQIQDESLATHRGGRGPEDGRLDPTWPVFQQHNLVRAVSEPFPGAFYERNQKRIIVWRTRPLLGEGLEMDLKTVRRAGNGTVVLRGQDGLLELIRVTDSNGRILNPEEILFFFGVSP